MEQAGWETMKKFRNLNSIEGCYRMFHAIVRLVAVLSLWPLITYIGIAGIEADLGGDSGCIQRTMPPRYVCLGSDHGG